MAAGSTYTPIATTTVGGGGIGTVTFSSIPSTYTDIIVRITGVDSNGYITVRFNNDSGANYSRTYLTGNGTSASSGRSSNINQLYALLATNSNASYQLMNYSNTTTYKTVLNSDDDATNQTQRTVGLWRSTSAINRIDFISGGGTINAGSTFTLYGIAAA